MINKHDRTSFWKRRFSSFRNRSILFDWLDTDFLIINWNTSYLNTVNVTAIHILSLYSLRSICRVLILRIFRLFLNICRKRDISSINMRRHVSERGESLLSENCLIRFDWCNTFFFYRSVKTAAIIAHTLAVVFLMVRKYWLWRCYPISIDWSRKA